MRAGAPEPKPRDVELVVAVAADAEGAVLLEAADVAVAGLKVLRPADAAFVLVWDFGGIASAIYQGFGHYTCKFTTETEICQFLVGYR